MTQSVCGGQRRTFVESFLTFTFTWVPGTELRSPDEGSKDLPLGLSSEPSSGDARVCRGDECGLGQGKDTGSSPRSSHRRQDITTEIWNPPA